MIIKGAVDLHTWARETLNQSPQKFLNFMHSFKHILVQIITNSGGQTKHLIAGLEKLQQASETVD
jgi:ribosomal protein L18